MGQGGQISDLFKPSLATSMIEVRDREHNNEDTLKDRKKKRFSLMKLLNGKAGRKDESLRR